MYNFLKCIYTLNALDVLKWILDSTERSHCTEA